MSNNPSIHLDPADHKLAKEYCKNAGITMAGWVSYLIRNAINNEVAPKHYSGRIIAAESDITAIRAEIESMRGFIRHLEGALMKARIIPLRKKEPQDGTT